MELDNQPLVNKVNAKLKYWSSTHLSLVCRTLIVNQVLISSFWHFSTVWAAVNGVSLKTKPTLWSYLWYGFKNMAHTQVSWEDYMIPKKIGGQTLTSPKDVVKELLSKWVIQAITPSQTSMHILLRFRLTRVLPSYHGNVGPTFLWLFSSNFSNQGESQVWQHVAQSWKVVTHKVVFLSPSCPKDL